MEPYFYLVAALLILAVADLIVGVSNDAVNFLNSAIGSKVASRSIIIAIAAAGVFVGATFSSGMMEVARKGIFNPTYFSFEAVMVIFMAVMITDILLLDLFNSLGMPTSTTVSIVFELLGAAVVTGMLVLSQQADPSLKLIDLINHSKAVEIIAGIFLSVGIAFTIGAIVQWLSRFWFTFHTRRRTKLYAPPFAGLAIAIIIYFLLVKGLKGASFVSTEMANEIANRGVEILGITFVLATILTWLLQAVFKINPLKIVVLLGTFSLAMAFAGNDLVNFIGVPITGFQSYQIWLASGIPASEFMMVELAEAVKTPSYMLYAAGLIMVLTLWFSAKARKVTDTEVKLGSQGSVSERFKPNALAHGIVRAATAFSNFFTSKMPRRTMVLVDWRFRTLRIMDNDKPAFDLVRASVNLMVASVLIAFASSLKLPLSTTYVSFMVAMGTSLADRAWGAESAPYRVAGVLNVIGGWFLTALGAFVSAGIMAMLIFYGGPWIGFILFLIALVVLLKSNFPRR